MLDRAGHGDAAYDWGVFLLRIEDVYAIEAAHVGEAFARDEITRVGDGERPAPDDFRGLAEETRCFVCIWLDGFAVECGSTASIPERRWVGEFCLHARATRRLNHQRIEVTILYPDTISVCAGGTVGLGVCVDAWRNGVDTALPEQLFTQCAGGIRFEVFGSSLEFNICLGIGWGRLRPRIAVGTFAERRGFPPHRSQTGDVCRR